MVLIFIRCIEAVKSELNEKVSLSFTSRDGGCFFRTLNFAHASD